MKDLQGARGDRSGSGESYPSLDLSPQEPTNASQALWWIDIMGRKDRCHCSPRHTLLSQRWTPRNLMYPLSHGKMEHREQDLICQSGTKGSWWRGDCPRNENICRFQKSQLIFLPRCLGQRGRLWCDGLIQSLVLTLHGYYIFVCLSFSSVQWRIWGRRKGESGLLVEPLCGAGGRGERSSGG